MSGKQVSRTVIVTNSQTTVLKLVIEPWADELILSSGESVELVFSGPSDQRLEVQSKSDATVLWGWEGAVVSIGRRIVEADEKRR